MRKQLDWNDARYFLTLARFGKMSQAAEDLGISAITLSRRMAQLQSRLGVNLFTRHNQGVHLTADGQKILENIERAEAEFLDLQNGFSTKRETVQGTVRIAASEGYAVAVLAPQIPKILRKYPDLSIEIVPLPRGFSLSKREADIAIMVEKPNERNLQARWFCDYRLGLYAHKDYLHKAGIPQAVEDLSSHSLVGYVDDILFSSQLNTALDAWANWESRIGIYSPLGQLAAIRAGAGIGVLHEFLLTSDDRGKLVRVLPQITIERSFYMVTHKSLARLSRIKAMQAMILEIGLGENS